MDLSKFDVPSMLLDLVVVLGRSEFKITISYRGAVCFMEGNDAVVEGDHAVVEGDPAAVYPPRGSGSS